MTNHDARFRQIGLDRMVRLTWLKRTSLLAMAKIEKKAAKALLQEDLKDSFRSVNAEVRGSIDKTITILVRIWFDVSPERQAFRDTALELLATLPPADQLVVHWGMTMATYPFWAVVATSVGRSIRLQGTAVASQIQRRIREQYGQRETVSRRVRYVLRSYLDWGVLAEDNKKGFYRSQLPRRLGDPRIVPWLVEAYLHSRPSGPSELIELADHPSLFPFRLDSDTLVPLLYRNPRLELVRHSLDGHLVFLRKSAERRPTLL